MDGTSPSSVVKEKHRLPSRLKAQVKILGRKSGGVWGGADFNAWSEAGIIDFNTK